MNKHLDPQLMKKIEEDLKRLHGDLAKDMHFHGEQIRGQVSQNFKESLSDKEELEIIEKEDSIEEDEIHKVEDALQRIAKGTFGLCLDCGKPIPIERLETIPYAEHCVPCQEEHEKNTKHSA